MKKEAIFCCFSLENYMRQSIITFSEKYAIHCHVVSRPPSDDAPFLYDDHPNITYYNLAELNTINLVSTFSALQASVVFVSGWIEKRYLILAKKFKRRGVPVIMSLDNHWTNTLKQKIGTSIASQFLPRFLFSHIWIAGKPQREFALKLGFKSTQILTGVCAVDTEKFDKGYIANQVFRNILFIGRLVPYKRPVELFQIFRSIKQNEKDPWKLTFIGNGECKSLIKENEKIKVINFLQPADLIEEVKNASVFCLPSTREHWGLVVHECCAAGKLLITSDKVGAASDFLIPDHNGFLFNSNDLNDLRNVLIRLFEMKDEEIIAFQKRSFEIGKRNSSEEWADKLYQTFK